MDEDELIAPNQCPICRKVLSSGSKARAHVRTVHQKLKPFQCPYCDRASSSNGNLKKHIQAKHLKEFMASSNEVTSNTILVTGRGKTSSSGSDYAMQHQSANEADLSNCSDTRSDFEEVNSSTTVHQTFDCLSGGLSPNSSKKPFPCPECGKTSATLSNLKKHIQAVHSEHKPFACSICGKTFGVEANMKFHLRTSHKNENFKTCEFCGKEFGQVVSYKRHVMTVHQKLKPYECNNCGSKFSDKRSLNFHELTAHSQDDQNKSDNGEIVSLGEGQPFKCTACGKTNKSKYILNMHYMNVHAKTKQFKCEICHKGFGISANLKKHILSTHEKDNFTECKLCGKRFGQYGSYKRHVLTVHEKLRLAECVHCKKKFGTTGDLQKHLVNVHKDLNAYKWSKKSKDVSELLPIAEPPDFVEDVEDFDYEPLPLEVELNTPECQETDNHFVTSEDTSDDRETIEIQPVFEVEDKEEFESPEESCKIPNYVNDKMSVGETDLKPPECKICQKHFARETELDLHILTDHVSDIESKIKVIASKNLPNCDDSIKHQDIEVFECKICGRNSTIKDYVKRHVLAAHVKLRPFSCEICAKSFANEHGLKRHIMTSHDNETFTSCDICGKRFGQISSFRRHFAVVHQNIRPFDCNMCDRKFGDRKSYSRHQLIVHSKVKPFKCQFCKRAFGQKTTLKYHMLAVHKKMKPFQCNFCEKRFGSRGFLNAHIKSEHGAEKQSENGVFIRVGLQPLDPDEAQNESDDCEDKVNSRTGPLQSERVSCTLFQCKLCDENFESKDSIKLHILSVHEKDLILEKYQ